jgi:hypothetical protein
MKPRQFGYSLDIAHTAKRAASREASLASFEATVERGGHDATYVSTALGSYLMRAQYRWVLDRPLVDVATLLRRAATMVTRCVDEGLKPDKSPAWHWLVVPLVAGDVELARRLGPLVGAMLGTDDEYLSGLVALLADDRDATTTAAAAFTARLDAPATSPNWIEVYQHLDTMLLAVATRDQALLATATAARDQAIIKRFGRNIESRRDMFGVLDPFGVAILRLAHVAGMTLNRDVSASLGIELIEYTATHPPTTGN